MHYPPNFTVTQSQRILHLNLIREIEVLRTNPVNDGFIFIIFEKKYKTKTVKIIHDSQKEQQRGDLLYKTRERIKQLLYNNNLHTLNIN